MKRILISVCLFVNGGMVSAQLATSCFAASSLTAVNVCRAALSVDPNNHAIRFALADAYSGLRRYSEAVEVLKQGVERVPGNQGIKDKLILLESMQAESISLKKQRNKPPNYAADIEVKRHLIRCTKLSGTSAIKSCDQVIAIQPDNPDGYQSKANALFKLNRWVEAIRAYQKTVQLRPGVKVKHQLQLAQSERQSVVNRCMKLGGTSALKACQSIWMKEANDANTIQLRIGDLQLAMGRESKASDVYQQILDSDPSNTQVQIKLAQLQASVTILKPVGVVTIKPKPMVKTPEPVIVVSIDDPPESKVLVLSPDPIEPVTANSVTIEKNPQVVANTSKIKPELKLRRYSNQPDQIEITH